MPQWRKLWVKATESLDINDMPDDFHRLLWLMMPLGVDAEGRGIDNPSWIKAKIMPLRLDVTLPMIESAMCWYAERGMVVRYSVKGRRFFHLPTFKDYQGNTEREARSQYPAPPDELTTDSRPTQELVMSESRSDSDSDSDSESDPESESVNHAEQEPVETGASAPDDRLIDGPPHGEEWEPNSERSRRALNAARELAPLAKYYDLADKLLVALDDAHVEERIAESLITRAYDLTQAKARAGLLRSANGWRYFVRVIQNEIHGNGNGGGP